MLVMVQTFAILQQLLPLGRLDGYLILTDLTGVPDLLGAHEADPAQRSSPAASRRRASRSSSRGSGASRPATCCC